MKPIAAPLLITLFLSPPTYGQPIPVAACGANLNVESGEYVLTQDLGPCAASKIVAIARLLGTYEGHLTDAFVVVTETHVRFGQA